ncbi:hypothetical protein [Roseibium sp.]|uniref:hypothetical protein n=1 Tax=Roseibium sp. TaxID=1936156 RepID=UPI003B522DF7
MTLLRMAFLLPALTDFGLAFLNLYRMIGITDASVVPRAQFAAVAFCWGLFLLMGLRRPIERAWILLPTTLVITLIAGGYIFGYSTGVIGPIRLAFVLIYSGTLVVLCLFGIRQARQLRAAK